jgi:hypothetical protein
MSDWKPGGLAAGKGNGDMTAASRDSERGNHMQMDVPVGEEPHTPSTPKKSHPRKVIPGHPPSPHSQARHTPQRARARSPAFGYFH